MFTVTSNCNSNSFPAQRKKKSPVFASMSTPVDYTSKLRPMLQQVRLGRRPDPKALANDAYEHDQPTDSSRRETIPCQQRHPPSALST